MMSLYVALFTLLISVSNTQQQQEGWYAASPPRVVDTTSYSSPLYEQTYYAPDIVLKPGQVANTDPRFFGPFPFPSGPIAVRYFNADVVDQNDVPVALSELYIHHWVIYANLGKFSWGPCTNVPLVWGIGAEMRGTVYSYQDPYAIVFDGTETLSGNLHFLRTVDVSDTQLCIECNCPGSTPTNPMGKIECCPDGSLCWSANASSKIPPKTYKLKYTLKWTDVTPDVKPLTSYVFDVTSQFGWDCRIEYQIPMQSVSNGESNIWTNSSTLAADINLVYLQVHQHVGGTDFFVDLFRNGKNITRLCQATPQYGTGSSVGNSKGYVVKIPSCTYNPPYSLKAGDVLVMTSKYSSRHIPNGHPYHEGVMGLVFIWAERMSATPCERELKTICGDPLPPMNTCMQCATNARNQGKLPACVKQNPGDKGYGEARFFCETDSGHKTPYPINGTTTTTTAAPYASGNMVLKMF